MIIAFISDLHLSEMKPHLTHLLEVFIEKHTSKLDELYILGDLFEYWVGDDCLSAYQHSIAKLFKQLSQRVKIYFMEGNRDFLLGQSFAELANFHLITEPYLLSHGLHNILLIHGDSACILDENHMRFRKLTQKRWLRKLFLKLPKKIRQQIAIKIRNQSSPDFVSNSIKYDIPSEYLVTLFHRYQVNTIIHGHTHKPAIELFLDKENIYYRYTLSDWETQGHYLKIDQHGKLQTVFFKV